MKKKFSLKSQITISLICFVTIMLSLIYLFQTLFLDDFYKTSKIKQIQNISNEIGNDIQTNKLDNVLESLMANGEVCIRLVSNNYFYNYDSACSLKNLTDSTINQIVTETYNNKGEKLYNNFVYNLGPELGNSPIYIYSKLINHNNADILILVSSIMTPINATISTIQNQYIIIVIVTILMSLLLSLLLTKLVVKPINSIKKEAYNLSSGKYNSENVKTNSKEFEDLNSTLDNANQDILKVDNAKKELLGNISHDLKTPLTMIQGYSEMMLELNEENNEDNLNLITGEAKRMSVLVDDLIDLSKSENKNLVLKYENVNLYDLLNDVYRQYKSYCSAKKISLKLNITKKEYKDIFINVDRLRINNVLYNFINNSINHLKKDKKNIEIGVEKNDDLYRIYVYDNGQGIDPKDIKYIWDRYYTLNTYAGSGLGLSICKNILEAHHFNYGVDSKINEYSKFYFEINVK